jgi:hypothetical protein
MDAVQMRRFPALTGQDEDPSTIARPSSRRMLFRRKGEPGFEFTYPIRQAQRVTALTASSRPRHESAGRNKPVFATTPSPNANIRRNGDGTNTQAL